MVSKLNNPVTRAIEDGRFLPRERKTAIFDGPRNRMQRCETGVYLLGVTK